MKTASSPGKSRADPLFSGLDEKPLADWLERLQHSPELTAKMQKASEEHQQASILREQRYAHALETVEGEEAAVFREEIRLRRELLGGLRMELPEDWQGGEYYYRYDSMFLRSREEERYEKSLKALRQEWESFTSSGEEQAGELLFSPLGRSCVRGLRRALEQGKKCKANACLDMLRFLPAVYRLCQREGEGVYSLKGWLTLSELSANSLFQAIDQYYDLFRQFEETEKLYYPCKAALAKILEQAEQLPEDVKDRVDDMGIKTFVQGLLKEETPTEKTEETAQMLHLLLPLQRQYTVTKAYSDLMACRKLLMVQLKEAIRKLVEATKRSTIELGSDSPKQEPSYYDRQLRELSEDTNRLVHLSYQVMEKSQRLTGHLRGIEQWPEQVSTLEEYEALMKPEEAVTQILQELWKKMEPLLPERRHPSTEEMLGALPTLAR